MVQDNQAGLTGSGLGVIDGATGAASSSGNAVEWVMRSYFSRLKLNWDNKYLFEVNLRADGSSRFMEGNRWGYFLQLQLPGESVKNLS